MGKPVMIDGQSMAGTLPLALWAEGRSMGTRDSSSLRDISPETRHFGWKPYRCVAKIVKQKIKKNLNTAYILSQCCGILVKVY